MNLNWIIYDIWWLMTNPKKNMLPVGWDVLLIFKQAYCKTYTHAGLSTLESLSLSQSIYLSLISVAICHWLKIDPISSQLCRFPLHENQHHYTLSHALGARETLSVEQHVFGKNLLSEHLASEQRQTCSAALSTKKHLKNPWLMAFCQRHHKHAKPQSHNFYDISSENPLL